VIGRWFRLAEIASSHIPLLAMTRVGFCGVVGVRLHGRSVGEFHVHLEASGGDGAFALVMKIGRLGFAQPAVCLDGLFWWCD
jgi:hypothetical protein